MLIDCPECSKHVSDRAVACPDCGFPIREWVGEAQQSAEEQQAIESREEVGAVDCVICQARGFVMLNQAQHNTSGFTWCPICGHSGRVVLCHASDGYYAVSQIQLAGFLAGELNRDAPGVDYLGDGKPEAFRFPQAGKLHEYTSIPEWYVQLLPKLGSGGE